MYTRALLNRTRIQVDAVDVYLDHPYKPRVFQSTDKCESCIILNRDGGLRPVECSRALEGRIMYIFARPGNHGLSLYACLCNTQLTLLRLYRETTATTACNRIASCGKLFSYKRTEINRPKPLPCANSSPL